MLILNNIIEIKLQIINVLNIQIKYLRQLDFKTVNDLQFIERKLVDLLDSKCKKIKFDRNVISLYNDQNIVKILKDVFLNHERILKTRNRLLFLYTCNMKLEKNYNSKSKVYYN